MERMAIDFVFRPIISDYFTKWTEAFALPNHQTMTVADVLVKEIFLGFGVPVVLHIDQGPEFRSDLLAVRNPDVKDIPLSSSIRWSG